AIGLVGARCVGLAACGSSSDSTSDTTTDDTSAAAETTETADDSASSDTSYEGVTIEFQQWWADELTEDYLQQACDAFYEETGITVECLTAPWADTKTSITSGAATGTVADIVAVDSAWLVDFADQGIITNLSDLFEETGFDTSLLADQWEVDGSTYAVPLLNFGYPLYCNMDILEAAGVESIPTTWTELAEACEKITAAGYEAFPINLGTQSPNGICNVVMGMASASGITMKNDDGTYTLTENTGVQELLEYLKELWDAGSIASGATTLEESEMTSNFTAGNYAFCIASMSMLSDYQAAGLNVECAKIPVQDGYTGESGMCVASWACGISESSENKEAAALFLSYLFGGSDGTDGQWCEVMAVDKSAFPSSTVADPDYSEMDEQFNVVYEIYNEGYPENQFIGIPETETVETDMTNALVQYLQGDIDVADCLAAMQQAIDDVQ
ncbi:MAG: sugar ABC transporter substrate-binding protein, partial [Clostridiales bacterium]|nr:sugar ABC transporter substrate-binding protein [Clostridiales bacterium]